jgi:hypothetical protein
MRLEASQKAEKSSSYKTKVSAKKDKTTGTRPKKENIITIL